MYNWRRKLRKEQSIVIQCMQSASVHVGLAADRRNRRCVSFADTCVGHGGHKGGIGEQDTSKEKKRDAAGGLESRGLHMEHGTDSTEEVADISDGY